MSDSRKSRPDLVVPDKRIVSVDEAREERKKPRRPNDPMHDLVSREEMLENLPKAALAIGQKMYDQVSEELAANFEEQEARMIALIERRIRERSLWYRLRRWLDRLVWVPGPALVVDPVVALDPGVHAAAAAEAIDASYDDELVES